MRLVLKIELLGCRINKIFWITTLVMLLPSMKLVWSSFEKLFELDYKNVMKKAPKKQILWAGII